MATTSNAPAPGKAKAIPDGMSGLIAHLVVNDATKALEFYKKAFGAVELSRIPAQDGKRLMHASMKIRDAIVFVCDDFPEWCAPRSPQSLKGTPVTLTMYVENTDAAIDKAKKAGAEVTMPAADMFWGDRYGTVRDPFGHEWAFATHQRDMTPQEQAQACQAAMANMGG